MCVYDQIIYLNIAKKGINIFALKGFLRGGTMLQKMLSYAPDFPLHIV